MSPILLALVGAFLGLLVALFADIALLPYVLKQQTAWFENGHRLPIVGGNRERLAAITTLFYRYGMPLFWTVFGAICAVTAFGVRE